MSAPSYPNKAGLGGGRAGECTQGVDSSLGHVPASLPPGLPAQHARARALTTWRRPAHADATGSWLAAALARRPCGQPGPRTAGTLPRPVPAEIGPRQPHPPPESRAGREGPARSASKTTSWHVRHACEVRGRTTLGSTCHAQGSGKGTGSPGRHRGGTCGLSVGGKQQETLGGHAAPHHRASMGRSPGVLGPDGTEQRSGQRPWHGCFASRELVLGSGHGR